MKLLRTATYVAAFCGAIWAGAAIAQNGGTMIEPRTQNNVTYVSGGVGEEQQEQMRQLAQQGYTLKLVFAEKGTGAYVADVRVIVADANGRTLLDTVANGPAFYARVPEGDYKVTVDYRGMQQTRRVHASQRAGQTMIYWNGEPGGAPAPASSRAPHAEGAAMSPPHAGESAGPGR